MSMFCSQENEVEEKATVSAPAGSSFSEAIHDAIKALGF
jgi:hypothetical protein